MDYQADFIVRKDEEYRKLEFERRQSIDIGGVNVSVVRPEDLVLSKLSWSVNGASEPQLRDAGEDDIRMTDTSPEVLSRYRAQLLALSPAARLAMASRMFSTAKALALAGILREDGRAASSSREQLFLRLYGREFDAQEAQRIVEYLRAA